MSQGIDVIGDIHGCSKSLVSLLELLGYQRRRGVYEHKHRKVLFLGDIIDRGPGIRESLHIVKDMVDKGFAEIILGNHEYNALAYTTELNNNAEKRYLRSHSPRNNKLISETLFQFAPYPNEWAAFLEWFKEIPFFIETPYYRAVHACWDSELIDALRRQYTSLSATQTFLQDAGEHHSLAHKVADRLLRGVNIKFPDGLHVESLEGFKRRTFRAKFWMKPDLQTRYKDVVFQTGGLPDEIAEKSIDESVIKKFATYDTTQQPLFLGHYWMKGAPSLLTDNIACLDYSAILNGRLMAYRFDGETRLDLNKFVWVDSID